MGRVGFIVESGDLQELEHALGRSRLGNNASSSRRRTQPITQLVDQRDVGCYSAQNALVHSVFLDIAAVCA